MTDLTTSTLEVSRAAPLRGTRIVEDVLHDLRPGQIVLDVEHVALSSNNLTYALLGNETPTRYWDVFPAASGWGRVPAWGSARAVAGDADVAVVGERFVGLVPMGDRFLLDARRVDRDRLAATSPTRAGMLPLYRDYRSIENDPTWRDDLIGVHLVLRPLYPIAALLAASLTDGDISTAVISSASSKTGLLVGRMLRSSGMLTIGLTSPARVDAAASTGAFEQVLPYPDLHQLPLHGRTVFLDIAGDPTLADGVRHRLGGHLVRHLAIGATHHDAAGTGADRPVASDPAVEQFDTARAESDHAEREGSDALRTLQDGARDSLVPWASTWLDLHHVHGVPGAERAWRALSAPPASPLTGTLFTPGPARRDALCDEHPGAALGGQPGQRTPALARPERSPCR